MIRQQLFIGAALIVGAAIGFCVQPRSEKAPEAPSNAEAKPASPIPDKGDAAVIASLRARIRELEARLADNRKEDEILVSNAVAKIAAERAPRQGGGPRQWMEEMKKRDPARFVQMTNHFAQMRLERKNRQAARAEFLASVNTSHMSASAKKTHDAYQELLAKREALEEKMHNPDLSDDERHSLMREMHEVSRQMRTLGSSEREALLGEVASAIGLEGDAAAELVETVKDVVEVTETGFGGGRHGPPPPGGPGMGQGPR